MAWTVTRTWVNPPGYDESPGADDVGPYHAKVICSLTSDGAIDASAQQMVDISALHNVNGEVATAVSIEHVRISSNVQSIELLFDHTTDQSIGIYPAGDNWWDYDPPINDLQGAGGTGDILFTTTGAAATSRARIELTLRVR